MPLYLPGTLRLGPRSSGVSTLPAFLTSIGKDSWYAGFLAPYQLYSDIANTVAVTTDGAAWRNWLPQWAVGFTSYFTQSTGFRRPALGLSRNGKPGIYGDAIDWYCELSSTTELNKQYTVLLSSWVKVGVNTLYSHNGGTVRYGIPAALGTFPTINSPGGTTGNAVNHAMVGTPVDATTYSTRVGWSTGPGSTAHYSTAINLFRLTTATQYTDSTIHEIWFTPWLTPPEISKALSYLA